MVVQGGPFPCCSLCPGGLPWGIPHSLISEFNFSCAIFFPPSIRYLWVITQEKALPTECDPLCPVWPIIASCFSVSVVCVVRWRPLQRQAKEAKGEMNMSHTAWLWSKGQSQAGVPVLGLKVGVLECVQIISGSCQACWRMETISVTALDFVQSFILHSPTMGPVFPLGSPCTGTELVLWPLTQRTWL